MVMVFNDTFNAISVISWWSLIPAENHPHVASYWHTSIFRTKWMIKFYDKWGLFSYFMVRTNTSSLDDDVHFVLDKHDKLDLYCATNNCSRVDVSLYSDILSWFRTNQYLLLLLSNTCLAEKRQNTDFIVLGLTLPAFEPTIYHH